MSDSIKTWLKASGYSLSILLAMKGMSYASLEEQVGKVNDLMLGKIASAVVGGSVALGGGYAAISGNVMKGLGIVGVSALIGIGVALIKNQSIFNLLS